MTLFSAIDQKLLHWNQGAQGSMSLKGVSPNQWSLLAGSYFAPQLFAGPHVIICADLDEAEEVFESLRHLKRVVFYPGHNHALYSSILSSESALLQRWSVLEQLHRNIPLVIIT